MNAMGVSLNFSKTSKQWAKHLQGFFLKKTQYASLILTSVAQSSRSLELMVAVPAILRISAPKHIRIS